MELQHIHTFQEYQQLLQGDAPVVIDFFATWCPPCRMIAPKFEALAKETTGIVFAKCDTDACPEAARANSISAIPCFKFFKNGACVETIVGADYGKLVAAVQTHKL